MALKENSQKVQSSLANFTFAVLDMPLVWKHFDWKLSDKRFNIVRNNKDISERLQAIQLSVLGVHIEIMRQAFYDYCTQYENGLEEVYRDHLSTLALFLYYIRNAFLHTAGELIPTWDKIKKDFPRTFRLNIPIERLGEDMYFSPDGKETYKLVWKNIKKGNKLNVTDKRLYEIFLLSHYVLEILKKRKHSTLSKYLRKNLNLKITKSL